MNLKDENMKGLASLEDREIVKRASEGPGGEVFSELFLGVDVCGNEKRSRQVLMNRLAFWCSGEEERMVQIFEASGFGDRDKKRAESLAARALAETPERLKPGAAAKFKEGKTENEKGGSFR